MKKSTFNNPNCAVGYCRYSSNNQSEQSIEAQQRVIQEYADKKNIPILKWYLDYAQTGTNADRTEFQHMIADSKERKFNQVLVYQLDRFARNKDDHVIYKVDLRKNGVRVFSVTEQFDDSPEGKLMESLIEGISAYTSMDIGRKTARGLKENAHKAQNNGGYTPYGYMLVPRLDEFGNQMFHKKGHPLHKIVINPIQAEAVKIMFNMTIEGKKRFEIIDRLNSLGYTRTVFVGKGKNRPKAEKDFTGAGTFIDYILRNEKYTGKYIYHYDVQKWEYDPKKDLIEVPDGLPQIISKETFEAVRQILKQRIREPNNAREEYLLTGKLICGECGTPYSGARKIKDGKCYPYYKCNRQTTYKNAGHLVKHCKNNTVRRDKIESYVIKQVAKIISDERNVDKVLEEYNRFAAEMNDNSELIEMYENQIKEIDKQITNLINAIAAMGNFNEMIQTKIDSLEEQKKKLTEIIAQEKKATTYLPATKAELKKVYKIAEQQLFSGSFEERKNVLQLFLNKVFIYREKVEIFVNLIPFSHLGGIDVNITPQEFIGQTEEKAADKVENTPIMPLNTEKTAKTKEKDGFSPSSSLSPLYSEISFGSPSKI